MDLFDNIDIFINQQIMVKIHMDKTTVRDMEQHTDTWTNRQTDNPTDGHINQKKCRQTSKPDTWIKRHIN